MTPMKRRIANESHCPPIEKVAHPKANRRSERARRKVDVVRAGFLSNLRRSLPSFQRRPRSSIRRSGGALKSLLAGGPFSARLDSANYTCDMDR